MSKIFSCAVIALIGASCATGVSDDTSNDRDRPEVPFEDPIQWIAIGTDILALVDAGGDHTVNLEPTETIGEVAIMPINPDAMVELGELIHHRSKRCGGFTAHRTFEEARDAALVAAAPQNGFAALVDFSIDNGEVATVMLAEPRELDIRETIDTLSTFRNRLHSSPTGKAAPLWIRDFWQSLAADRDDITVELVDHTSTPQQSVMMTITGTTTPNEVVVMGGHLDSIAGGGSDPVAPGADDDASGIATISEVARTIVATDFRPERTIHIIGYAAEEVGLRGSAEIAQDFADNGINVVAVMQFDMTNFNGSSTDIVFIRDRTDDVLTEFVASLVDTYLPELTRGNGRCNYGCSDHASWNSRGFPAVFPFEAQLGQHSPNIHTANDTLAASGNEAVHALKFAKLGAAFVAEVAKGSLGGDSEPPPPPPPPPDPNSCEETQSCGEQAPGGCWCDQACLRFNDCCSDGPC